AAAVVFGIERAGGVAQIEAGRGQASDLAAEQARAVEPPRRFPGGVGRAEDADLGHAGGEGGGHGGGGAEDVEDHGGAAGEGGGGERFGTEHDVDRGHGGQW